MLPRPCRVRTPDDFRHVMRGGRKAGRRRLSVHVVTDAGTSRAGFIVGRVVGGSVVRHRVVRRLRDLVARRMPTWPAGTALVVRAHPAAGASTSADLAADLDGALRTLGLGPRGPHLVLTGSPDDVAGPVGPRSPADGPRRR